MSFRSRLSDLIDPKIKYYDKTTGKPKTTVKTGAKQGFGGGMAREVRTKALLENYWNYYTGEGTIWAAVNSIAFSTIMVGYDIISNDPEAKRIIENWCRKVNLQQHMLDNVTYALVLGDGFMEIIGNKKGEPSNLKVVDPKTMEIEFDDYGIVQSYKQSLGIRDKSTVPKLEVERICHLKLFSRPDSPYGIALLKANMNAIKDKIRVDQALTAAIIRHGTSKLVFSVGSEKDGQIPGAEILNAIEKEVEDMDEKNELIVPWNVNVYPIDEKGIQGVQDYYGFNRSQVIVGMLCPEEVLGLGATATNATSQTKAILFERMIRSFQNRISRTIEEQLFKRVLQSNGYNMESKDANDNTEVYVRIKFNSVTSEDDAMNAKWMGNLIRGFRSSTIKPFTINEIRRKFGEEELDLEEANTILYGEFEESSDDGEKPDDGSEEEPITDEEDDKKDKKVEKDEKDKKETDDT